MCTRIITVRLRGRCRKEQGGGEVFMRSTRRDTAARSTERKGGPTIVTLFLQHYLLLPFWHANAVLVKCLTLKAIQFKSKLHFLYLPYSVLFVRQAAEA